MANMESYVKELDRLKKSELIEIIIKRKVPTDTKVSDLVRKYVDEWEPAEFFDSTSEVVEPENEKLGVSVCFKYELKCANTELLYLKKLNSELEKTILDKELIINLLSKDLNYVNSTTEKGNVANVTNSDVGQIDNKNSVDERKKIPKVGSKKLSYSAVASAVMQTKTQQLCNKYINLGKPEQQEKIALNTRKDHSTSQRVSGTDNSDLNSHKTNKTGKFITRKNNPNIIVGTGQDSVSQPIKGVPKCVELHVYRLEPHTKGEQLTEMLKPNFPEVTCEQLTSKHPEIYSSFKVSIHQNNFKDAMDPSIWPHNACIKRFLRLRKKENVVT